MTGATRPHVGGRLVDHARPERIEIDVTLAVQHIAVAINKACLVTAFLQGACTVMAGVELADVAAAELLHQASNGTDGAGSQEQVDVIVHEDVGVQRAIAVLQGVVQ